MCEIMVTMFISIHRLTTSENMKTSFRNYLSVQFKGSVDEYLIFVESCNFPDKKGIRKHPEPVRHLIIIDANTN